MKEIKGTCRSRIIRKCLQNETKTKYLQFIVTTNYKDFIGENRIPLPDEIKAESVKS